MTIDTPPEDEPDTAPPAEIQISVKAKRAPLTLEGSMVAKSLERMIVILAVVAGKTEPQFGVVHRSENNDRIRTGPTCKESNLNVRFRIGPVFSNTFPAKINSVKLKMRYSPGYRRGSLTVRRTYTGMRRWHRILGGSVSRVKGEWGERGSGVKGSG